MKRPSNNILISLAAGLFLLLIIAWMAGFFTDKIEPGRQQTTASDTSDALAVREVTRVIKEAVPASISAKQATMISSRIMARITNIHVGAGDTVTEGQLLVELEQSDLQARARQARQRIRAIEARLTEARQNLQRIERLFADGVVSQSELDRARANEQALTADLESAKLALEEAQAAVAYTEIRSPIDGRVVDRFAEPGDTATPGTALLSIYNPTSLQVEAHVREKLALNLSVNDEVEVNIPVLEQTLPAFIEEFVPAADPGSRTFLVKARFQFDSRLRPGMYARLLLPGDIVTQVMIPRDRIAQVGQLDVVWIASEDGTMRRYVQLGQAVDPNWVVVTAGLDAGDSVLPIFPQ